MLMLSCPMLLRWSVHQGGLGCEEWGPPQTLSLSDSIISQSFNLLAIFQEVSFPSHFPPTYHMLCFDTQLLLYIF